MAARTLVAFCTLLSLVSYVSAEDRYQERRERERHFINGRVVQVVDGDTCVVEDRTGHRHNVNLYGVDAPENGQPYWTHARDSLSRKIYNKEVRFEPVQTDAEGRTCGSIYVGDHHINVDQVREGYGWHHTDHERIPEFAAAERDARDHHRGLWADRTPVEPWKYRHDHREARRETERERER
jgi:endonuclease YncB( thermonuclease family)